MSSVCPCRSPADFMNISKISGRRGSRSGAISIEFTRIWNSDQPLQQSPAKYRRLYPILPVLSEKTGANPGHLACSATVEPMTHR